MENDRKGKTRLLLSRKHLLNWLGRLNELLHHAVKLGKLVFALFHLRNKLLFLFEFLLAAIFELNALAVFVLDAGDHEVVVGSVFVFGKLLEEIFDGDEREFGIFVAARSVSRAKRSLRKYPLVVLRSRNL